VSAPNLHPGARNVVREVDRPKVDRAEADYLTPAQLRSVLDALRGNRIEPLILLLASTGLRVGEALALRWSDVDLDAEPPRLRVTGTVRRVAGRVERTAPKSQRSRRTLPLSTAVVDSLRSWRKAQASERLRAGTSWEGDQPWVFTTESGRPLDQRNAARAYARALATAELAGIPARFHVLRHSVASAMLANGAVSIRTASEILGHSTTNLTADLYAHVAQDAKVTALGVVDAALGGGTS
jgi:integrase